MATPETSDRTASRRTRALLAGGLVLGLGAAASLAAFTDSEYASGTFQAGQFNVQGSESRSTTHTWSDHFASPGATLTFSTGFDAMQPGSTYYAPFSLRIDPTKNSYDGSTVIQSATGSGNDSLESQLSWGAKLVADPTQCTATGYANASTTLVAAGAAMDYTGPSTAFTLPKSSTPVTVCLAVSMAPQTAGTDPATLNYGTTAVTEIWQFVATSV